MSEKVIVRPIRRLRITSLDEPAGIPLEIEAVEGRAKWVPDTRVVSIKLLVREDTPGHEPFIEMLQPPGAECDLVVVAGSEHGVSRAAGLRRFRANEVELRGVEVGGGTSDCRYLITGTAEAMLWIDE